MENRNKLRLTDENLLKQSFVRIEDFYADPSLAQHLNQITFQKVFHTKFDLYKLRGLLYTTINRYFLADIKIFEHCLIAENLKAFCLKEKIKEIEIVVHKRNRAVSDYYQKILVKQGLTIKISFHTDSNFWINSLTRTSFKETIKSKAQFGALIVGQTLFLCVNKLLSSRFHFDKSKIVIWHSFANNREKVDYHLLNSWQNDANFQVIHPNPYTFRRKQNWNFPIYFIGKYSISPMKYLSAAGDFWRFKEKFNSWVSECLPPGLEAPTEWNNLVLLKTKKFLLYNLLSTGLIENLSKDASLRTIHIFRGGSAAGLISSGLIKKSVRIPNIHSILVPHGTEFNILDHFSYFYLDYNILPSEGILKIWESQLNQIPENKEANRCSLKAGGRIDYETLLSSVKKKEWNGLDISVGIVLTYNTQAYQDKFISDIINEFRNSFPEVKFLFRIKPRSNYSLSMKVLENFKDFVVVDKGDIFTFLSNVDIVIGTVSTYGILTMVVTDAILCDIPALYYIPNPKFNESNLGYSYHASMKSYTYNDVVAFRTALNSFESTDDLKAKVKKLNNETRSLLIFDGSATSFLHDLITTID